MPDRHPRKVEANRRRSSRRPVPIGNPPPSSDKFAVVAVGASAGGLDACRKLVSTLPAANGMAFILVQHLDPTHESMMVDLLAGHTSMLVLQAIDGMPIEPNHLYVIPPGTYLSVRDGALRLSRPQARHGARLPFDFLLNSLAEEDRYACHLRDPFGNRGRWQPWPEGREGKKRTRHRAGPR